MATFARELSFRRWWPKMWFAFRDVRSTFAVRFSPRTTQAAAFKYIFHYAYCAFFCVRIVKCIPFENKIRSFVIIRQLRKYFFFATPSSARGISPLNESYSCVFDDDSTVNRKKKKKTESEWFRKITKIVISAFRLFFLRLPRRDYDVNPSVYVLLVFRFTTTNFNQRNSQIIRYSV